MDFTPLFQALLGLLCTIITVYIIPVIKAKLTAEQQKNAQFWVNIAVEAAEKWYKEEGQGQIKKAEVLSFLHNKKINYSGEELDAMIESAVRHLKD